MEAVVRFILSTGPEWVEFEVDCERYRA